MASAATCRRLIGRTSLRASMMESATAAKTKAPIRSAVRQIFPRREAKTADSGCSTNTFQPTGSTVAQAERTFTPPTLRPFVEPDSDEDERALRTCGRFLNSCGCRLMRTKTFRFGYEIGCALALTA